jgi:hypothetical protein
MIDNKWFCEPDEQRETWCFLNLHVTENCIISDWEVGYGNPTMIVREIKSQKTIEIEIIKDLLTQLYHCRKENILLITYSDVLSILRTRIFILNIKDASLYGLKHICIKEILKTYFQQVDKLNIQIKETKQIQFLWNLLLRIGPLLPRGVMI